MAALEATEMISRLRSGQTSSVELTEQAIAHIEEADPSINAIVVRDFKRARKKASEADQARAKGVDKPLLGLPLTVKEAFDVEGLPTTWGLPGETMKAKADAALVERLRDAGAIILGKSNVATMLADWQTANEVYGRTSNPWDVARTPGGSSGGGAAAVATGMVPLEFGSDLAGSLRVPASFSGVFAHRSSHGLVPMRGFAPPMAPRLPIVLPIDQASLGPIARSARDLELALDVVAGPDRQGATAWRLALPPPRATRTPDFRVLVLNDHPLVPTASSVSKAIGAIADKLDEAGATVAGHADALPDLRDLFKTFSSLLMALMGVDAPEEDYRRAHRLRERQRHERDRDMTMSHRDWTMLDRHRLELTVVWSTLFADWDVVLCPATPCTAFPHDDAPMGKRQLEIDGEPVSYEMLSAWSSLAIPTGLPATSVPIGLDDAGMPIGAQVIGPRWEDHTTIAFAGLLEHEFGCTALEPAGMPLEHRPAR